ncbi:hypothetical protein FSP39_008963 [Pinctada imbricata]|uniref:Uncharacterized protein n=1 Tax=Pinctada imbricata TaxID=66713 RepID=A0AA89C8U3_PINIB|nr:hypothetical protein FSP39_008963 [Pinctada imbricata]
MGLSSSRDMEDELNTPPKIGTHKRIVDMEFDPRSPSAGISRTPIVVEKTPEGVLDPRSPTPGILRTPITTLGKESTSDLAPLVLDVEDDIEDEDEEDVTDTERLLREIEEMPEIQTLAIADTKHGKIETGEAEKKRKKKSVKAPQPKQLFPAHRLATENKDMTRSPLATRTLDMNSPRVIVQRKQAKKIENSKTCAMEHAVARDKENLHHQY